MTAEGFVRWCNSPEYEDSRLPEAVAGAKPSEVHARKIPKTRAGAPAGLTPYSTYRPSGADWLEEVPEHWEVRPLRRILSRVDSKQAVEDFNGGPALQVGMESVESWTGRIVREADELDSNELSSSFAPFLAGDILFGKLRPYLAKACRPDRAGLCSSEFIVLRGKRRSSHQVRYLLYALLTPGFISIVNSRTSGARMPRASWKEIGNVRVPLPVPSEARAIVFYLDRETAKIDALIGRKEALVERLKEYRTALVSRTVTWGLPSDEARKAGFDPRPKLKPSGVDALGHVPKDSDVQSLRHLADIRFSSVDKHIRNDEDDVRVCNYVDVYYGDHIDRSFKGTKGTATPSQIAKYRIQRHDVIITKDSEVWYDIGVPVLAVESAPDIVCGYHLALLRPVQAKLHGPYLYWALQVPSIAHHMHVEAKGVTRYGLSVLAIQTVRLPLPSLPIQRAIASYLDRETAMIDKAAELARQETDLLREYRTRLISDVVTGKVDVRGVPGVNVGAAA